MNQTSWSNLTVGDTELEYIEICQKSVEDDSVFSSFKRDPRYTIMLEHVSPEQGQEYIETIDQYDIDNELISKFKEN